MSSLLPKDSKSAQGKIVILYETPFKQPELKELYNHTGDVIILHEFLLRKSIVELLKICEILCIDLTKKEYFQYWIAQRGSIDADTTVVVFKKLTGLAIEDQDKLKKEVGADYVIKTLPTDSKDKEDFVAQISNDHISQSVITKGLFKRICLKLVRKLLNC